MKSIYEIQMAQFLKDAGIKFKQEYKFCPTRKWQFDFLLEPIKTKIAIEIEGGTKFGRSRHSKGNGFVNDCEKYNTAQLLGYIVLRYTPEIMFNVLDDLKKLK